MAHPVVLAATALGFGIAYAAAPGVVNTEAIRRGARDGARSAFFVEAGSLIGDSLWALLALTGVALLARQVAVQAALGFVGGCFLLRVAWIALHDAWLNRQPEAKTTLRARGDFATGVFFGLANPFGIAFWSGLGGGAAALGATGFGFMLFFAGFFAGALLWAIGIWLLIAIGRRWVRPELFRVINALCGLAIGYFGIRLLWTTASDIAERAVSSHTPSALRSTSSGPLGWVRRI